MPLQKIARENNWSVPPASQIISAWRHFKLCRAKGVLIYLSGKELCFGPMFAKIAFT